ncbi:MAG: M4 family metallopeptidase [Parashewanella sp.]
MTSKTSISLLASIIAATFSFSSSAADIVDLGSMSQSATTDLSQHFQLDNQTSFKAGKAIPIAHGKVKYRLQQYYQGIPVFGYSISSAKDNMGMYADVQGLAVTNFNQTDNFSVPSITPEQALNIAIPLHQSDVGMQQSKPRNKDAKLWVWLDSDQQPHLVYITNYLLEGPQTSRPYTIVDAHTGKVLDQWEGLTTEKIATGFGGNEKIGKYEYGKDFDKINVTKKGNTCYMKNDKVMTIDLKHWHFWNSWLKKPVKFDCPRYDEKEVNGGYGEVNDAQYFGGVIFDMYKDWFNAAPLTIQLVMRVHYLWGFDNAMWNGKNMTFGDGQMLFYPLVALDVTAHEISHGFTEQNSGLVYKGQSGGMNEAFSDMAGEAAKYYMRGKNDFKVGAQITKKMNALRYFDDPTKDGMSIGSAKDYKTSLNVHFSSGVYNKAFYTLATTNGWNTKSAFEVFAKANQLYWNANSSFKNGACGVVKAAKDMDRSQEDVLNAFAAVDIVNPCS